MSKKPFPGIYAANAANRRKLDTIRDADPYWDIPYSDSDLNFMLRRPLFRLTRLWRDDGHSGFSPFGLAALTNQPLEKVLTQLDKERWVRTVSWCGMTGLPILYGAAELNFRPHRGHPIRELLRRYDLTPSLGYKSKLKVSEIREMWEKAPSKLYFAIPGKAGKFSGSEVTFLNRVLFLK